jgi:uncharacterized protein YqgQ
MEPSMRFIWVTFDKIGYHKYPAAPDEVAYLRNEHRHIFKFKVHVTVEHDDREIEFHMLKNWLLSLYQDNILKLDYKSCEMIAQELADKLLAKYPGRKYQIEVSEDGECGAVLVYNQGK